MDETESELQEPTETVASEETQENAATVEQAETAVNSEEASSAEVANEDSTSSTEPTEEQATEEPAPAVQAHVADFANLGQSNSEVAASSMSRFLDVSIQVSAELGSIRMPIGDVLQLGEGSVIELNRNLSEPIDLVAQGVRIARGEVVVIDDCFAIRIKEIESNQITR